MNLHEVLGYLAHYHRHCNHLSTMGLCMSLSSFSSELCHPLSGFSDTCIRRIQVLSHLYLLLYHMPCPTASDTFLDVAGENARARSSHPL